MTPDTASSDHCEDALDMVGVKTWNTNFNDAAEECGLSAQDILTIDNGLSIGAWTWLRVGNRVTCASPPAVWSVHIDDLINSSEIPNG